MISQASEKYRRLYYIYAMATAEAAFVIIILCPMRWHVLALAQMDTTNIRLFSIFFRPHFPLARSQHKI